VDLETLVHGDAGEPAPDRGGPGGPWD
jgi:hypothetical protein